MPAPHSVCPLTGAPSPESHPQVLGPDALVVAAQSGDMPLPYAGPGPCRTVQAVGNVSLDLSAAATGCRGTQCAITLHITAPAPGTCAAFPGPRETVYLISGAGLGRGGGCVAHSRSSRAAGVAGSEPREFGGLPCCNLLVFDARLAVAL